LPNIVYKTCFGLNTIQSPLLHQVQGNEGAVVNS